MPDASDRLLALATYAAQLGQDFDRTNQVSVFGSVERSIPMNTEFAREGLRRTGHSVVEFYYADVALRNAARSVR